MYIIIIVSLIIIILLAIFLLKIYRKNYADNFYIPNKIVDKTTNKGLNMSYMPKKINNTYLLYGYSRDSKKHSKLYEKIIDLEGKLIQNPQEIKIPVEVKDTYIGEVKSFILNNQFCITTHFFGKRDDLDIFPYDSSAKSKELYFKSKYKNYIWNTVTNKIVPIHYDILPGKNLTNKNFLFFEHFEQNRKIQLVITNVSPHNIYTVDINSGYLKPYSTTNNYLETYFNSQYDGVFLSGGPIRLQNQGCYLVAGHIAKGGWGGRRMTFFYTFRDTYPFDIIAVSIPITFGYDKKLEYCNQIFKKNDYIYLSIGVKDKYSVLISVKLTEILAILIPIGKRLQIIECYPGENAFSCNMEKIWGPDVEAEFISEILHDYYPISATLNNIKKSSVLGINISKYTRQDVKKCIEIAKPKVLIILGDEWGKKRHYESLFKLVPLVYRQYRFNHYSNPDNVHFLPIGYHCWDKDIKYLNYPKKYIWSFIGSYKNNRKRDLTILDQLKPNFYGQTKHYENTEILNSSIFVFCPKGLYNVETSRTYTASICGAIPIILCSNEEWNEIYPYYDIEPPWLHTNSVENIVSIINELLANPQELYKIQKNIIKWTSDIKKEIYLNINNTVTK